MPHTAFSRAGRRPRYIFYVYGLAALAFLGLHVHKGGEALAADVHMPVAPREDYTAGTGNAAGLWTDTWTTPSGDRHTVVEPPVREPDADAARQPLLLEPRVFPRVPPAAPPHFRPEHRNGRGGY